MKKNTTNYRINIRSLGASGEKSQDMTTIFQQAIDRCHEQGGGVVEIPPGEYTTATVRLKDNICLHLFAGAKIFAGNDAGAYDVHTDFEDTRSEGAPVLLYAKNVENISIIGQGAIIGQPEYDFISYEPYDLIREECEIALAAGCELKRYAWRKPNVSLVYFTECRNVRIEGISLVDSPFWALHIHWCDQVTVHGIYIESSLEKGVNSDGLDIDGSHDVVISGCIIKTGDDAICLKTTNNNGAYRSCENITVTGCILTSTSCALKIGTESHGDFQHILFNTCIVRDTNRGFGIIIRDGGTARDIIVSNITMELNRKPVHWWGSADPFWIVVKKRRPDSRTGRIENVSFTNIKATAQGTSKIEGFPGNPIRNIHIDHFQLTMEPESTPDKRTSHAIQATDADSMYFNDISVDWNERHIEPKWEHVFAFENITNLHLDKIRAFPAPAAAGVVVHLKNVRQAFIERCHAMPDTATFLFLAGSDNSNILLKNNYLQHANNICQSDIENSDEILEIDG